VTLTFREAEYVRGITLLNNELYVMREQAVDQVQVYSTSDFTLLQQLSVPGLRGKDVEDMTSCEQKQCIYASDSATTCVHRVGLDRSVSTWPVKGTPRGLSVTRSSNLLVTCCDWSTVHGKLMLLRSDSGECAKEITLESHIEYPWHAVQLNDRQYVVCYGLCDKGQLSQVDADGKVVRSNNGDGGLKYPCHLAVDSNRFVFVADKRDNRIVLFDPSLNYVRSVVECMQNGPKRLCFDDVTRRLYVGQYDAMVSVVQL